MTRHAQSVVERGLPDLGVRLKLNDVQRIVARLPVLDGAADFVSASGRNYRVLVVSGAFTELAANSAHRLGHRNFNVPGSWSRAVDLLMVAISCHGEEKTRPCVFFRRPDTTFSPWEMPLMIWPCCTWPT